MSSNLWALDHPYIGPQGNYYRSTAESHKDFECWTSFFDEFGDSDLDYNFVYRWDWTKEDPSSLNGTLSVFFVGQRKGTLWSVDVAVHDLDQPDVLVWLATRWEHMQKMWMPFVANTDTGKMAADLRAIKITTLKA